MKRRSDLSPPLGYPGGPGYVGERIEEEVRNPALRTKLQEKVEEGEALSNPEAAQVYDLEVERGPGSIFRRLEVCAHAQYRMDLRGITVTEIRLVLGRFLRAMSDWKSRNDWQYGHYAKLLKSQEPLDWTDPKLQLTVAFVQVGPETVRLVTTYWKGQADERKGCRRASTDFRVVFEERYDSDPRRLVRDIEVPEVEGEPLDFENWETLSLDADGLVAEAGGDWQDCYRLAIGWDEEKDGPVVISCEPKDSSRAARVARSFLRRRVAELLRGATMAEAALATRVALLHLRALADLVGLLRASADALDRMDGAPLLRFLEAFWGVLDVRESDGELGPTRIVTAEWYASIGPRQRSRALEVLNRLDEMRGWIGLAVRERDARRVADYRKALLGLEPDVRWLQSLARDPGGGRAHGPFTVEVVGRVPARAIDETLAALDGTAEILRRAGFPKLLYGRVLLSPSTKGGLALYVPSRDTIHLSLKARRTLGDTRVLLHEFGHRLLDRFWKDHPARIRFMELSTTPLMGEPRVLGRAELSALADEMLGVVRLMRERRPSDYSEDLMAATGRLNEALGTTGMRAIIHAALRGEAGAEGTLRSTYEGAAPMTLPSGGVLREPLWVTEYARQKQDWQENFCEAFSMWLLGQPVPEELRAILEKI